MGPILTLGDVDGDITITCSPTEVSDTYILDRLREEGVRLVDLPESSFPILCTAIRSIMRDNITVVASRKVPSHA